MKTFRWIALAVLLMFIGCDGVSEVDGPAYARGGKKIKALDPDSLAVLPAETTIYTWDGVEDLNDTLPHTVQLVVQFWQDSDTYLLRAEDGKFYRANLTDGCLIDRPNPLLDTLNTWLYVRNIETDVITDSAHYSGVAGLKICPR